MSTEPLGIDYNWKQAATQEGVDVAAVSQSFMDQSYGLVANKAKVLFRDPYRLGFEVVHRNEKATKMTGFFAFRVGKTILYAPVFFVNGEVKPADMLYRGDVKRFVPLTEEWCERLVRSTDQSSGTLVERSRQMQPDSYLHRLAYPQHTKYAAATDAEWPENALDDMLKTAADAGEPLRPLLAEFATSSGSPEVLEKLAALIENSETARTWMVDNYDLVGLAGDVVKQASELPVQEPEAALTLVTGISKSAAAQFESVAEHGYALIDKRASKDLRVITEVDPDEIRTVNTPGQHNVLMADGKPKEVWLFDRTSYPSCDSAPAGIGNTSYYESPRVMWAPDDHEANVSWNRQVFYGQNTPQMDDVKELGISVGSVRPGEVYIFVNTSSLSCFGPQKVRDVRKDGESRVISLSDDYGATSGTDLTYTPDRTSSQQFISDDFRALPVKTKAREGFGNGSGFELVWSSALMSPDGLKDWIYSAGGIAESEGLSISKDRAANVFDITHEKMKMAGVSRMEAHAFLASELDLSAEDVGRALDRVEEAGSGSFRVWSPPAYKSAFVTRARTMLPWMKTQDPLLGVPVDMPQEQVLSTYTPQRRRQVERFGDKYQGSLQGKNGVTDEDSGLPGDAIFTMQPEQLAELSAKYDMPHIFDHGALSSLAESDANTLDQVRQYIPDLEQGVDRCFRILFLLRYRPADFEEAYGRDEMLEMESEMAQLAQLSGSNLLRLLKRFDAPTTGA